MPLRLVRSRPHIPPPKLLSRTSRIRSSHLLASSDAYRAAHVFGSRRTLDDRLFVDSGHAWPARRERFGQIVRARSSSCPNSCVGIAPSSARSPCIEVVMCLQVELHDAKSRRGMSARSAILIVTQLLDPPDPVSSVFDVHQGLRPQPLFSDAAKYRAACAALADSSALDLESARHVGRRPGGQNAGHRLSAAGQELGLGPQCRRAGPPAGNRQQQPARPRSRRSARTA